MNPQMLHKEKSTRRISELVAVGLIWLVSGNPLAAFETQVGKYQFRVAEGFALELVAAPPLVKYPICADFDEKGRLYVCQSSGSMDWNKPQQPGSMHQVLRLEDTNGDGIFDDRKIYAEFEMMAQGSMWLNGSLYVAAAPIIWKLTDQDDDGVADVREAWVKTDATTNCLNDLRGPYLGPDGYIYWSKGPALQEYMVDGKPWQSTARHIMRRHPQGINAEPLMVGGMDNPIEIAFTPGGQRMITCTYIQPPGAPRDDGILHAIYGGVYPKDIAPIYEFPWTGPDLLTPLTTWGAVSPAGLMCYQSSFFGDAYQGNLFSAHFNGHRIFRHALAPKGSTFQCTNEELIGCENVDFHPTEVMEDADGSLIVIETGGWYRNCCPSSTFYRPDVDGAIYRIRRVDAKPVVDPRGNSIAWDKTSTEEACALLSDDRPAVRRRATERLAAQGTASLQGLENTLRSSTTSKLGKLAAIWTTVRIDDTRALALLRHGLEDPVAEVRQAALHSLSLRRDPLAIEPVMKLVLHGDPHDRRLAAEALGRLRNRQAVPTLLEAMKSATDRSLEHAIIYAMIEINDPASVRLGLKHADTRVRRAALIAIDQMPAGTLEPGDVLKELASEDKAMQEAAWWIVSLHPQAWGGLMTEQLRQVIASDGENPEKRSQLRSRLARLARSPELAKWIVDELTASGVSASTQMLLLQAMGDTGGQYADPDWVNGLLKTLQESGRKQEVVTEVIATLAKLPPLRANTNDNKQLAARWSRELMSAANDATFESATRLRALASVKGRIEELDDSLFEFLTKQLAPEQPIEIRGTAAEAIARAKLTESQKAKLAGSLKNLALTELSVVLAAFQGVDSEEIGRRLVNSLLGSKSADSLNAFRLKSLLEPFGETIQKEAQPLLDRLEQSQAEQLKKADAVSMLVASADPHRGLNVFRSQKAACTACHKAANVGGITGPSLKGIGARRSERDLIESIIFPNATMVQSYETWKVLTDDGQVIVGVLIEDRPDEIVLSSGLEKNFRIPRSSIESMSRSEQSVMPTGLDKLITEQEFADLIAYLKSI